MKPALPAVVCIALLLGSCARRPPAIESFIPAGTTILAGVDLDRLRASSVFPLLPPGARSVLQPFAAAHYALLASNGGNILAILRGPFRTPPDGATMASADIALAGPPASVRAALAQQKSGVAGAPALWAHAQPYRTADEIWLVVQGAVPLPLPGNYANLNRLLRDAQFTTIAVHLADPVQIAAVAETASPADATEIEQTLRAIATLSAAGNPREAALLQSIHIARQDRSVHADLSIPAADLGRLF